MQWKARYSDGEELWETPELSTAGLDRERLVSFELTEGGIVRHRWTFDGPIPFDYRLRTRIPLLPGGEIEQLRVIRYGDSLTYVYDDRTETVPFGTESLPSKPS